MHTGVRLASCTRSRMCAKSDVWQAKKPEESALHQRSNHAEVRDTVTSDLKQTWDTKCTLESHWREGGHQRQTKWRRVIFTTWRIEA